jgi:hypothetical protein
MSQIIAWLKEGDIRSIGRANEIADLVLENTFMFEDLLDSLGHESDVVRAHGSDAIEKVIRVQPHLLAPYLDEVISLAEKETRPVVKLHFAMLFGHLLATDAAVPPIKAILLKLLADQSVFTSSWAIASLCILVRKYPDERAEIIQVIGPLQSNPSAALRSRAKKAMNILLDDSVPFIKGWVKCIHLSDL